MDKITRRVDITTKLLYCATKFVIDTTALPFRITCCSPNEIIDRSVRKYNWSSSVYVFRGRRVTLQYDWHRNGNSDEQSDVKKTEVHFSI